MGTELFLHTHGACFLCLKKPSTDNDNQNGNFEMLEVCLRNICRFLNISPHSILLESLEDSILESGNASSTRTEKCDFTVMLCVRCSSLVKTLCDLIGRMEMIQFLTTYHLQTFVKKFEADEEAEIAWKERQNKIASESENKEELVEAILVETLRRETKKRSSTKLKHMMSTSFPKVSLTPLDSQVIKEVPTPSNDPGRHPPTNPEHPKMTSPEENVGSSPSLKIPRPPVISKKGKATKTTNRVQNICSKYIKKFPPENIYRCTICNKKLSSLSSRIHFVNAHPALFFTDKELHLCKMQFNNSCKHFLQTETKNSEQTCKTRGELVFICSICNRKYKRSEKLNYHLITKHYDIMQYKLSLHKITNDNHWKPWVCHVEGGGCGKSFSSYHRWLIHKKKYCLPQKSTRILWTCTSGSGGCGQNFSSCTNLIKHKRLHCPSSHKRRFLQKSPPNREILMASCTPPPDANITVNAIFEENCAKPLGSYGTPGYGYKCGLCPRLRTASKLVFHTHLVAIHAEKFFPFQKFPQISEDTFVYFCRRVLNMELWNARERSKGLPPKKIMCSFCSIVNQPQHFKLHLVLYHLDILSEKLNQLQNERIKRVSQIPPVNNSGYFKAPNLQMPKSGQDLVLEEILEPLQLQVSYVFDEGLVVNGVVDGANINEEVQFQNLWEAEYHELENNMEQAKTNEGIDSTNLSSDWGQEVNEENVEDSVDLIRVVSTQSVVDLGAKQIIQID